MKKMSALLALLVVAIASPVVAETPDLRPALPSSPSQCLYYDPPGVWVMRDCPTSAGQGPVAQNQTPLSPTTSGYCSSLCLNTCFFTGLSNTVCAALCCN